MTTKLKQNEDGDFVLPINAPKGYDPAVSRWVARPGRNAPGRGDWKPRPMDEDEKAFMRSFLGKGGSEGFTACILPEGGIVCNFYNGSRHDFVFPHSLAMLDSLVARHVLTCDGGWTIRGDTTYAVSLDYHPSRRWLQELLSEKAALA